MTFILYTFISGIFSLIYASFFEWTLHRFIMHKPVPGLTYSFKAHAQVHHKIFRADDTYHLVKKEDLKTIRMAWWNGPVLVVVAILPFLLASFFTGQWGILLGSVIVVGLYFGMYEYLHFCMHLPRNRSVERTGMFFRLNGHHLLHHRYMKKNFNVVFPLADWILGTLLIRSPIKFKQVRGKSVPDVQPK